MPACLPADKVHSAVWDGLAQLPGPLPRRPPPRASPSRASTAAAVTDQAHEDLAVGVFGLQYGRGHCPGRPGPAHELAATVVFVDGVGLDFAPAHLERSAGGLAFGDHRLLLL